MCVYTCMCGTWVCVGMSVTCVCCVCGVSGVHLLNTTETYPRQKKEQSFILYSIKIFMG